MKEFISLSLFIVILGSVSAQKKPVELTTFGKWPSADFVSISNDGKYVVSAIDNQPLGNYTIIIKSTFNDWAYEVVGCNTVNITSDSKRVIFIKGRDSLVLLTLGSSDIRYMSNVVSYKIPTVGDGNWIAYVTNETATVLNIMNLNSIQKFTYAGIKEYLFSPDGKSIVVASGSDIFGKHEIVIHWLDLEKLDSKIIYNGTKVSSLIFSSKNDKIAFINEDQYKGNNSILVYTKGDHEPILLAKDDSWHLGPSHKITNLLKFSCNDSTIFFSLKKDNIPIKLKSEMTPVNVWSYNDVKLQTQQLKELNNQRTYSACVWLHDRKINQLESEGDVLLLNPFSSCTTLSHSNGYLLLRHKKGDAEGEWNWNQSAMTSFYLISPRTGHRILVKDRIHYKIHWELSSDGNYLVFYDPVEKGYLSFNIKTGKSQNLTTGINAVWTTSRDYDMPMAKYLPIGGITWLSDARGFLVYDQWDVYQIDPSGIRKPKNVTEGFGKRNNIVFRLAEDIRKKEIIIDSVFILSAFNLNNKNDGFYKLKIGFNSRLEYLTMQPYIFRGFDESNVVSNSHIFKSRDSNVYVTRRMSASECSNIFYTRNFKTFYPITNVHPQLNYNWVRTELIKWKTYDGRTSHGILYKPENFNPVKKYPIIFHYYEKVSDGLNAFLSPSFSNGEINVEYFVSNGYLVFTPDIHYKVGTPGMSVVNTIVSAARYLSKFSFIDSTRMGIQGHSRGGWETNYLVTHTNVFAAAMSSAGMSNYTNLYLRVRELSRGVSRTGRFETEPQRIGATLWQRPDLYVKNSPVFKVHNVKTPVLLMANVEDGDVPFEQGLQFFLGLRRLGKRAWMLQYDGQDHVVFGKPAEDLTIRMKQFFDHYLKDSAAPKWMIHGIPASMKGIDDGLELVRERDPKTGKWITPKESPLLTPEERKKVEALRKRKPITMTFD